MFILFMLLTMNQTGYAAMHPAGDLAPLGSPDGLVNAADLLLLQRIVASNLTTTDNERLIGDIAPIGNPDGLINAADLVVMVRAVLTGLTLSPVDIDNSYPPVPGASYKPSMSTTWQWQLNGPVNTGYNADLYDIDLFDAADVIVTLHSQGKKVICYFSAGTAESWRSDYANFLPADMGNTVDGWAGERWLDIRSDNVRAVMLARLDLGVSRGCDGVEPDNVENYNNATGFGLTAADQLAYNRFIANEAHIRGLAVGLKNDSLQAGSLVDYFDFAINEQCFQYDECGPYKLFTDRNKPVFNAEYPEEVPSLNSPAIRQALCQQAAILRFHTLMLPLNLNDAFRISCD